MHQSTLERGELHRLLADARRPGAEHFTIARADALRKAARYQLDNPRTYILKLVQWVVRAQPTAIHVITDASEIRIEHDRPVSRAELLRRSWLEPERDMLPLAVGMWSASSLGVGSLHISSWDEEGAFELDLMSNDPPRAIAHGETRTVLRIQGVPSTRLAMRRGGLAGLGTGILGTCLGAQLDGFAPFVLGAGLVLGLATAAYACVDFMSHGSAQTYPEVGLLAAACRHAPIPVLVNGRAVNRPFFGRIANDAYRNGVLHVEPVDDTSPIGFHRIAEDGCWVPSPLPADAQPPLPYLLACGQPVVGCRAIYHRAPRQNRTTIDWVKDGVTIFRENPLIFPTGFHVVACAHDLDVDISHFRPVENARHAAVLAAIGSALRKHPA